MMRRRLFTVASAISLLRLGSRRFISPLSRLERSHETDLLLHDLPPAQRDRIWHLARQRASRYSGRRYAAVGLAGGLGAALLSTLVPHGHLMGGLIAAAGAMIGTTVGIRIFLQSAIRRCLEQELEAMGRWGR